MACGRPIPPAPQNQKEEPMSHTTITKVQGFEVLDSRGNPTVRVEVTLQSGAIDVYKRQI